MMPVPMVAVVVAVVGTPMVRRSMMVMTVTGGSTAAQETQSAATTPVMPVAVTGMPPL